MYVIYKTDYLPATYYYSYHMSERGAKIALGHLFNKLERRGFSKASTYINYGIDTEQALIQKNYIDDINAYKQAQKHQRLVDQGFFD